jgi:hypothetical protein
VKAGEERTLRPQLIVFTYHKTGTVLFEAITQALAAQLGLKFARHYGFVRRLDPDIGIALLAHSLVGFFFASRPFRAVRLVRDPRDIWVSGYLYHRHCREGWCTNTNFDPSPPIAYPRVDYSFQHYPEEWKQRYLAWLGGKSYQQNLIERDLAAGLDFELAGYTGCTLDTMRSWWLATPELLDVQLEAVASDFDATLRRIFVHLGLNEEECKRAVELAAPYDLARMTDAEVSKRAHIHSRQLSKWRDVLSAAQIARFEAHYRDLIRKLGYPLSNQGEPDGT